MRLEYLADGSLDCPLIRLFDFTLDEAGQLAKITANLATGHVQHVPIHDLSFVMAIDGCQLDWYLRSTDQGIIKVAPMAFECGLTVVSWDNMSGLIEPFASGSTGYQWLVNQLDDANLLISPSGKW